MRLDQYLTQNFQLQSRNKAAELIKNKKVSVNGNIINKSSYKVEPSDSIEILEQDHYVSRAAHKLKYFLEEINLDLTDKTGLDIGSSTGGFTQVLLENSVKSVTCVDVGSNQLHDTLRGHPKIQLFEQTDIRLFKTAEPFDIVVCDVSFISILNILEDINRLAKDDIIILFKPQFEVGQNVKRDRKGVVKDQEAITLAKQHFLDTIALQKWKLIDTKPSKLEGKEGNIEELYHFKK